MTGPDHYQEAEKILREVAENPGHLEGQHHLLTAAQVHATLALAAATENPRPRRALPRPGRASLVPQENKLVDPRRPGVATGCTDRTSPSPRSPCTTSAEPRD